MTRLAGVLVAGLLSCNPSGSPGEDQAAAGEAEATVPALSPTMAVRVAGDTVTFVLQIANGGPETESLEFSSGQRYDFIVRDATGAEIWRWSSDQGFIQALGTETLEAGGVLEYEAQWLASGQRGEYEAVGLLVSTSHPIELTTPFVLGDSGGL
jgi:hypothetical protein